jgi:predicted extracellular nuclease
MALYMLGLTFFSLFLPIRTEAQESFRVMFWNTENLFDTQDDPKKNDNEFLPDATRHWTFFRYRDKLKNLAKGIIASGDEYVPDLVGLCEVENDSCIHDLVRRSPLREAGYRYVMTHSPDHRGIDVALLYQRGSFRLLQHQSVRIPHEQVKREPTRDILHVVGRVVSGDTLDVMVCHMPSRSGGQWETEPYRMFTAKILRQVVDSVMNVRTNPYLIIMGDFNDYPTNRSLKETLCGDGKLTNLMQGKKEGTYRFRGEWGMLDQFLVSENLLKKEGSIRTSWDKAQILRYPFLLEEDEKYGGEKPFRTYNGMKYQAGFSDHLPIALDLWIPIRDDRDCCSE